MTRQPKQRRSKRFDADAAVPSVAGHEQRVDVHCHCLPGLDDGPVRMTESLDLCQRLVADGINTVIATPHQLGRYDGRNTPPQIRAAVAALNQAVAEEGLSLRVSPGAEVRIDERIPGLLAENEILTLADGGRYLLLELPYDAPISPVGLAQQLWSMGIMPILAHPERCGYLCKSPASVLEWLDGPICLQLTAGSIVGAFGPAAQQACWYWLRRGAVALVASDAHDDSGRRPYMSAALAAISRYLGAGLARQICVENPQRVLSGEAILPLITAMHREMQAWPQTAHIA